MCVVIIRQFYHRHKRCGRLARAQRYTLIFTLGMLAITTGWYIASATYNSLILAGGVLFLPPEEREEKLTMCNPAPIARDSFKSLQILGADGLLVRRSVQNHITFSHGMSSFGERS
jgi:hypothetical protein